MTCCHALPTPLGLATITTITTNIIAKQSCRMSAEIAPREECSLNNNNNNSVAHVDKNTHTQGHVASGRIFNIPRTNHARNIVLCCAKKYRKIYAVSTEWKITHTKLQYFIVFHIQTACCILQFEHNRHLRSAWW